MTDWFTQEFGECSHGYIKPYCGQCAVEDDELADAEKALRRERTQRKGVEEKARRQSTALDDAYSQIHNLERQLRRGRSKP